jgi:hypothetical protein
MLKAERDEEEFDSKTSFLPAAPSNEEDLREGYGILLKAESFVLEANDLDNKSFFSITFHLSALEIVIFCSAPLLCFYFVHTILTTLV